MWVLRQHIMALSHCQKGHFHLWPQKCIYHLCNCVSIYVIFLSCKGNKRFIAQFLWLLPAATKLWPRQYFYTCLSFCSQGGVLPQCMLGYHTPLSRHTPLEQTPREQTPPSRHPPPRADTPLGADTPQSRSPPEQTPPKADTPPRADTPREADSTIQSTSGRYASYWNAFLFFAYVRSWVQMVLHPLNFLFFCTVYLF